MKVEKKKNKREIGAEQTQEKIRKIVIDLMRKKNFEQITIREICKEAGVSVGTFYLYFKSKEEALLYSHRFIDNIYEKYEPSNCDDYILQIREMMMIYFKSIADDNFEYIKHIYIAQIICYSDYIFSHTKEMYKCISTAISKAQEKNLITKELHSDEVFRKLMICARGHVYDYCINPVNTDSEAWLKYAFDDWNNYFSLFFVK